MRAARTTRAAPNGTDAKIRTLEPVYFPRLVSISIDMKFSWNSRTSRGRHLPPATETTLSRRSGRYRSRRKQVANSSIKHQPHSTVSVWPSPLLSPSHSISRRGIPQQRGHIQSRGGSKGSSFFMLALRRGSHNRWDERRTKQLNSTRGNDTRRSARIPRQARIDTLRTVSNYRSGEEA